MNEIKIAICNDSESDCEVLLLKLYQAARELKCIVKIQRFFTGQSFLREYDPALDMLFLSIQLPDMEGARIAQIMRKRADHTCIIFLLFPDATVYDRLTAYESGAKTYIIKPYPYKIILKELKQYLKHDFLFWESYIWGSREGTAFKIYLYKLRFIETAPGERRLIYHYYDQTFKQTGNLSDLINDLPKQLFFRCNHSYIVNLKYIDSIIPEGNRYRIQLITGESVPLSRNLRKELFQRLKEADK